MCECPHNFFSKAGQSKITMATLLPSISSDEEDSRLPTADNYSGEESEDGEEVNEGFVFGGALVSYSSSARSPRISCCISL